MAVGGGALGFPRGKPDLLRSRSEAGGFHRISGKVPGKPVPCAVKTRNTRTGPHPQKHSPHSMFVSVIEAVDPIVLDARVMDCCGKRDCDCELCEVPSFVNSCFDGELSSGDDSRRIYVTLGQFSIVRLERDSQLLVPVYDYCMPDKECSCGSGTEDPCGVFRNIAFPVGEFFPPNTVRMPENYEECCCACRK